jgi:hypothetical protein
MRTLVFCSMIFAVAGYPAVATSASAACSNVVKQALDNSKWRLKTEFTRGDPGDWKVTTAVATDGKMSIATRRGVLPITCRGNVITFDWKNEENKRYTLTLKNPSMFSGSRAGNSSDYDAALVKR